MWRVLFWSAMGALLAGCVAEAPPGPTSYTPPLLPTSGTVAYTTEGEGVTLTLSIRPYQVLTPLGDWAEGYVLRGEQDPPVAYDPVAMGGLFRMTDGTAVGFDACGNATWSRTYPFDPADAWVSFGTSTVVVPGFMHVAGRELPVTGRIMHFTEATPFVTSFGVHPIHAVAESEGVVRVWSGASSMRLFYDDAPFPARIEWMGKDLVRDRFSVDGELWAPCHVLPEYRNDDARIALSALGPDRDPPVPLALSRVVDQVVSDPSAQAFFSTYPDASLRAAYYRDLAERETQFGSWTLSFKPQNETMELRVECIAQVPPDAVLVGALVPLDCETEGWDSEHKGTPMSFDGLTIADYDRFVAALHSLTDAPLTGVHMQTHSAEHMGTSVHSGAVGLSYDMRTGLLDHLFGPADPFRTS